MFRLSSLFDTFSQHVGQASRSEAGHAVALVFVGVVLASYVVVILRRRLK